MLAFTTYYSQDYAGIVDACLTFTHFETISWIKNDYVLPPQMRVVHGCE